MRRFAHAAVFAVAISAPILAGALMDHSVVSVLGAPGTGPCKSSCNVGGAAYPSPAQGGHTTGTGCCGTPLTVSGTMAVNGTVGPSSGQNTGRTAVGGTSPATISGNFTNGVPGKGHCTGFLMSLCG
jgi:hypothetical protein